MGSHKCKVETASGIYVFNLDSRTFEQNKQAVGFHNLLVNMGMPSDICTNRAQASTADSATEMHFVSSANKETSTAGEVIDWGKVVYVDEKQEWSEY